MSDGDPQRYPLTWPDEWPRVPAHARRHSAFARHSMEKVFVFLCGEMERMGVKFLMSSNIKRRKDGQPFSNEKQPADTGVAVYFELKGKKVSLACDKWTRVECNAYAIAKHIEALRGQQRWGVGNVEQAFRGYMALPAVGQSGGDRPWEVLGVAINATEDQVLAAFRTLAKKYHPDNPETGDAAKFNQVRAACDLMTQNFRK